MKNIIQLIQDVHRGNISSEKFRYKTEHLISSNFIVSKKKQLNSESKRVHYADICNNKLIVTTDLSCFILYDLEKDGILEPTQRFFHSFTTNPKECLPCFTWGTNSSFILGSGCSNNITLVDSITMKPIKKINLMKNIKPKIRCSTAGHETSPFNNNLTAVACKNGNVPVFDLRTGDSELLIRNKLLDVSSIAWSKFYEPIIATTSANSQSLEIWDVRNFRQHQTCLDFHSTSLPDLKFTDHKTIVSLSDESLDVIDILKEQKLYSININTKKIHSRRKYRFSVNYKASPKLIYFPSGNQLKVLDMQKTEVINSYNFALSLPITMTIFNDILQEIYLFPNNDILAWK